LPDHKTHTWIVPVVGAALLLGLLGWAILTELYR